MNPSLCVLFCSQMFDYPHVKIHTAASPDLLLLQFLVDTKVWMIWPESGYLQRHSGYVTLCSSNILEILVNLLYNKIPGVKVINSTQHKLPENTVVPEVALTIWGGGGGGGRDMVDQN